MVTNDEVDLFFSLSLSLFLSLSLSSVSPSLSLLYLSFFLCISFFNVFPNLFFFKSQLWIAYRSYLSRYSVFISIFLFLYTVLSLYIILDLLSCCSFYVSISKLNIFLHLFLQFFSFGLNVPFHFLSKFSLSYPIWSAILAFS